MFNNQKGFTLIELMVVVVIIGILAAIALPNFLSMQDRAKESEVKANAHTLQLAVEDYKTQSNGAKPTGAGTSTFVITATVPSGVCGVPSTMKNAFVPTEKAPAMIVVAAGTAGVTPTAAVGGTGADAGGTLGWVVANMGRLQYIYIDPTTPYGIVGEGKTAHVAILTEGN